MVEWKLQAEGMKRMDADPIEPLILLRNAALRQEFVEVAAQAKWCLLKRDDIIKPQQIAHLIVIGVAFWSRPDLHALNKLSEKLSDKNVTVFVFDIDEFGFSTGVKAFIPGVEMPNETPVVAEYINGTLVSTHQGDAAFKWIKKL